MPRRKAPPSLRCLGLQNICQNFELICYGVSRRSSRFRSFLSKGSYLNITNSPLKQLPVHVFSELTQAVLEELGSSPHILHAVIQPQMTECRLPSTVSHIPLAIKLLVERTHRLHTFELTGCRGVSPLVLAAFLPYLQNLTYLNLEGTSFDDFGVEQLGQYVEGLVTLSLARTKVTDEGLSGLDTRLQHLTFCILLGNRVSPASVLRFLVSHPHLMTLEYERMKEVLVALSLRLEAGCGAELGLGREMNLRKIVMDNCREEMNFVLKNTAGMLPFLEAVSINNSELSHSLMAHLAHFKHLEKLELGNSMFTQYTVNFHQTVLPVLETLGSQLTHLSLENFKFFDVTTVGKLCPKLVHLKLSNILSYCRLENQRHKVFQHLEELYIFNTAWGSITEGMLRQLLSSSRLRLVNLQLVSCLTDELFRDILVTNHFPDLTFVSLEQCHRFSYPLLSSLLTQPPLLSSLHVWSCGNIGSSVKQQVEQLIERHNLDINFQWQGVPEENIDHDILNEDEEDNIHNLLLPLVGVNIFPDN